MAFIEMDFVSGGGSMSDMFVVIDVPIAGKSLTGTSGKYYHSVDFSDMVPDGYIPFTIFENGYWIETCTYMLNTDINSRRFYLDIRSASTQTINAGVEAIHVICMKQFNL